MSKKRQAFRVFKYQGMELEQLLELPHGELMKMLPSRCRRKFNRGIGQKGVSLLKKLRKAKIQVAEPGQKPKIVKTHLRNMIIFPEMIGSVVSVYTGKQFVPVDIKPQMVGKYLGEFAMTYKPVRHGKVGIGATRGSKFIPLR
eukprot:gnl/Dysnectes_brevis/20_a25_19743.p2 GENE.gnl/Dysnectes_brevis/20_a25_19743~~gnl/Dysnectes_brevis/20_a25_19743.p2  ORF type:complete len:143 (+),score=34.99 gnl/Dysnectes_brevis/20_a25_19743:52-480(+)